VGFVNVVSERAGYSFVACMFSAGFFPHFIKIFRAAFPPHWTNHLQPLDVTVMRLLTAKHAVTQNDWMIFWAALKILAFVLFQEILLVNEVFKAASVVCGGNNEPSVLIARSVG